MIIKNIELSYDGAIHDYILSCKSKEQNKENNCITCEQGKSTAFDIVLDNGKVKTTGRISDSSDTGHGQAKAKHNFLNCKSKLSQDKYFDGKTFQTH